MAYIVIDIFSDKDKAEIRAETYRKTGRKVEIKTVRGITVNDCTVDPCIAKHDQDGNPLYVVLAEG
ncbi:MAG: hypothetical protein FJ242_02745 [Nitrospira sp.]|nr:hypothetical protein [Nitrospira sp.]